MENPFLTSRTLAVDGGLGVGIPMAGGLREPLVKNRLLIYMLLDCPSSYTPTYCGDVR